MFDDVEFIEIIEDVRGNTENRLSGRVNGLENGRSQIRTVSELFGLETRKSRKWTVTWVVVDGSELNCTLFA